MGRAKQSQGLPMDGDSSDNALLLITGIASLVSIFPLNPVILLLGLFRVVHATVARNDVGGSQ